jgi:hypothetical protein
MVIEFISGETPCGSDDLTAIEVIGNNSQWVVPTLERKEILCRKYPGLREKIKTYKELDLLEGENNNDG